jgi:hypothetical protein
MKTLNERLKSAFKNNSKRRRMIKAIKSGKLQSDFDNLYAKNLYERWKNER